MLKTHEIIRIPDENRLHDLQLEVNWSPKDKATNECKFIRVHFPDGKVGTIKKEHLNAALFAFGTAEEQRKMVPQTTKRVKWYETVVSVQAKKDIRKGEAITFPIKITLPSVEEEAIAEIKNKLLTSR